MTNKVFRNLSILFLVSNFVCFNLNSQISSSIVVKVGNSIVTSSDLENEVMTYLVINQKEATQKNVNQYKKFAIKNMVNKLLKLNEVKKYNVIDYSEEDLLKYQKKVAGRFNTNINGLKKIFEQKNIDYSAFIEKYEIELRWNTLIYIIYKNQINVNIIEVENEVNKRLETSQEMYNLSEITILNAKYNKEKLNEILNLARNESFELAAKRFSDSVSATNGGLIGWIEKKSITKDSLEKIKNLKINEISQPLFNKNSVLLLKVNNIKKNENIKKIGLLKKEILNKKKEDKLNLFSRSHFSNLQNSIPVIFK
jgi:peptidyl-prolyl cis-trans isomerase SurA